MIITELHFAEQRSLFDLLTCVMIAVRSWLAVNRDHGLIPGSTFQWMAHVDTEKATFASRSFHTFVGIWGCLRDTITFWHLEVDMALRIIKSWVSGKLFSTNFQDNFRIWLSVEAVQIKKFRSALNLSTLGGTSFNQSYLNCILVSTKLDHSFYKKTCVLRRFSSIYNSQ